MWLAKTLHSWLAFDKKKEKKYTENWLNMEGLITKKY